MTTNHDKAKRGAATGKIIDGELKVFPTPPIPPIPPAKKAEKPKHHYRASVMHRRMAEQRGIVEREIVATEPIREYKPGEPF